MDAYSCLTDKELIFFLKNGDNEAFKTIYDRYQNLLYQFACKKIRDRNDAKDIIQEVFVNLWNNRDHFELKAGLDSYLYRSVLNRVLNIIRHNHIHDEYVQSLQQVINETAEGSDYRIREKDIERLIALEIAALPPKMREVFELRKKEFMSNKQIADQLGLSEQTVETHMKRALRVLRMRLGLLACLFYLLH